MADYEENLDHDQVTLYLEDDTELRCDIMAIFPARDAEYIALLPNGDEEADAFIDRVIQNPDDDA